MGEEGTQTAIRRDRFSGGPARSFLSSMSVDERIFTADLAVDRAHVVMLATQEIITEETATTILAALREIEAAGYEELPAAEDIHEAIETAVIDRVGPDGGRMHTARSRNDEVATCLRYQTREDLLSLTEAVIELRAVLVESTAREIDTLMPGHTHLQPAQPTTVAHWAMSYVGPLARDTGRLLDAYPRVNRSPLGGAAFAGTPFPVDRHMTAELLGFHGLVTNAMDAAASRDVLLEVVSHANTLAVTLSGLAADLIMFAHQGWVELSDEYASTSSIMPQKKNPDTLELARASAGDTIGGLTGLSTTLKGLPRAYNRDLQAATPHVWNTLDAVTEATTVIAGAIKTASWNEAALAAAAGDGFSTATGVADELAAAGLPFRQAHELVALAASKLADDELNEETAIRSALEEAAAEMAVGSLSEHLTETALTQALDPAGSVASRDSVGGPAPEEVAVALAQAREDLGTDRAAIADLRAGLAASAAALAAEVDTRVAH